ncbi:hypothetical protein ACIA58_19490 [Kribbella sp. NPDC051586]|uniref:hypothetical protein n=1 Tax=Kribbella sp. NPDC051586 TaxID=3364118 RepID=UPI0037A942CD
MTKPLTNAEENPHAGKGSSVLLDIGDGIGAILVTMPAGLEDVEIERRAADAPPGHRHEDVMSGHGHGHRHGGVHDPHVAVVPRPSAEGQIIHSAVFSDVPEGRYDLYVMPDGPVRLTVDVRSGEVTEASWPDSD